MTVTNAATGMGGVGSPSYPQASLYVGDLQPEVLESQLFEKFSTIGPVLSIRICRDAISKASLGYGYINFGSAAHAEKALEELNFETFAGHPIRLMWSHRDPTIRKAGNGNIFIKNLSKDVDNHHLLDTFGCFGKILSCKVALNDDGSSKGFAFVHFDQDDAAAEAIAKVNGKIIKDKKVFVGLFKSRAARAQEDGAAAPKFTNVYVKNLNMEETTEENLRAEAAKFGDIVSFCLPTDAETKRPRGFAFIAYAKTEEAAAAVAELNGKEVHGVKLYAGRAMKKDERQSQLQRLYNAKKREVAKRSQGVNLYIKNLEDAVDEERLRTEFAKFGSITSVKLMTADSGVGRGFGFVCFANPEDANKAVTEMNGRILSTKPLYVALAQRKEDRRAQLANQFNNQNRSGGAGAQRGAQSGSLVYPPNAHYNTYNMNMATNTGYPSQPGFVASARVPPAGARWGYGGAAANLNRVPTYPSYGPPAVRRQPVAGYHQTSTNLIRNFNSEGGGGGPQGRWAGAASSYPVHFTQGARNRPAEPSRDAAAVPTPLAEQKQILGEELYAHVAELIDEASAGKVTGMLLEMPNSEVVTMLHQPPVLQAKVQEAMTVLQESGVKA